MCSACCPICQFCIHPVHKSGQYATHYKQNTLDACILGVFNCASIDSTRMVNLPAPAAGLSSRHAEFRWCNCTCIGWKYTECQMLMTLSGGNGNLSAIFILLLGGRKILEFRRGCSKQGLLGFYLSPLQFIYFLHMCSVCCTTCQLCTPCT